jgi:hypothetical protein
VGAGAVSILSLAIPNLQNMSDILREAVLKQTDKQREVSTPTGELFTRIHLKNLRSHESVEELLNQRMDCAIVRREAVQSREGWTPDLPGKSGLHAAHFPPHCGTKRSL